jgi:hypothetical protein
VDTFLRALTTRHRLIEAEIEMERERQTPDGDRLIDLTAIRNQIRLQIDCIRRGADRAAPREAPRRTRPEGLVSKPAF